MLSGNKQPDALLHPAGAYECVNRFPKDRRTIWWQLWKTSENVETLNLM
jgi:hypothetical protein